MEELKQHPKNQGEKQQLAVQVAQFALSQGGVFDPPVHTPVEISKTPVDTKFKVGPVIARHRTERDLSQGDLAVLSGLTRGAIGMIESNRSRNVRLASLIRLALALEIEPGIIIQEAIAEASNIRPPKQL